MTVKHNAYPPFLYRDYKIDPDDLLEGLFESSVLLKVGPECRIVVAYLTELISSPSPLHRWPDIFLSLQARQMKSVCVPLAPEMPLSMG